jgi:peroxiredoxin Q/BCP
MLAVGDVAPEFEGLDQDGRKLTLSDLLEKGKVVLYFYPRDFTTVCTQQVCLFRDADDMLGKLGAQVVRVSSDSVESHRGFANKHGVGFRLLADPDLSTIKAYDVNRWLLGFAKRVTYVIGRDRRILGVFHHELSAQKHVDDVIRLLETPDRVESRAP